MTRVSSVDFPRVQGFIGCDNGRGIVYGSLVPTSGVPENYREAVLRLRDFFTPYGSIKVDVVKDDNGDPVINIYGDVNNNFWKDFNLMYSLKEGTHWKAIHEIVDPLKANLNPNIIFGTIGFFDGSML